MNTVLVDDTTAPFFAPVSSDLIDGLIGRYRQERQHIEDVAQLLSSPQYQGTVNYFLDGNAGNDGRHSLAHVERLFEADGAIKSLNASYWNQALKLTDVLDCMPEKRRQEWYEQIREKQAPEFEEQTVRSTLMDLLASRTKFFAERVDGIFQSLSREHVTNCPEGFGKRMILFYVITSYNTNSHDRIGYINDLRAVIAKLTGRDEPKWNATHSLIATLRRNTGKWFDVDGGAFRIRLYKKGTAHIEVHPDMAWRLNQILAYLHPLAIPSEFRSPPKRRPKTHKLMQRPLPFAVIGLIDDSSRTRTEQGFIYRLPFSSIHNQAAGALEEAGQVMQSIGGVKMGNKHDYVFDYLADSVLEEIVVSGCIPDKKSHQFYPTPLKLARLAVERAEIEPHHHCYEPSAGHGALAELMPKDQTTCIEISQLHCEILKTKGYKTVHADFLTWAPGQPLADRIVMNPPFSDGRWQAHIHAASELTSPGGRLVAILPSGAKNKNPLKSWNCTFSPVYDGEFSGASVSVVIMVADRPA